MTGRYFSSRIELNGLELAASQVWGGIRIVPVLRQQIREDLRLALRRYEADLTLVTLEGKPEDPRTLYCAFVPHGIVVSWSPNSAPVAAFGAQILRREGKRSRVGPVGVQMLHRMVRREERNQLRFLPLHLAMEGFLDLHFGGPAIAWAEYAREVADRGLGFRIETAVSGRWITGLEDALRVFEIHEQQVGLLLFVGGALASAFVVPHPDDYRLLHRSLLEDFYGELLYYYGLHAREDLLASSIDAANVSSLSDLRHALAAMRAEWAEFQVTMGAGFFERDLQGREVYHFGPFRMHRFITDLALGEENHMGEAILREDGALEYLKTYRLSQAQTRRAFLLGKLAEHDWNVEATAQTLGQTHDELIVRLDNAGFGYLLREHVLHSARRRQASPPRR